MGGRELQKTSTSGWAVYQGNGNGGMQPIRTLYKVSKTKTERLGPTITAIFTKKALTGG